MPPTDPDQNPNQPATPPEAGPAPQPLQAPQPVPPTPDTGAFQQPSQPIAPQPQFTQPAQPAQAPQPPQPGMQFAPPQQQNSNVLGILGIVLAFFFWPAGLVCSIIALKKHSNKALAIIGLVLNILSLLATVGIVLLLVLASTAGIQSKAKDVKYTTDIKSIQSQLEAAYATDGAYPSLEELNSESWRQQHMKGLSPEALSPNSSQTQLVSGTPTDSAYAYTPLPSGCADNTTNPCKSFDLAYRLSSGTAYSVHSFN